MSRRILLIAGWLFPVVLLALFVIKGRYYDPAVFAPPASEVAALPIPAAVGDWILEDGSVLPAERMFEKIDGKADYYLQYGAVELCSGEWSANGQSWDMYLYGFAAEQGASGAFNGERPSDGIPLEGIEGYTVPGQAAIRVGTYYLQLFALTADADPAPAVELARALAEGFGGDEEGKEAKAEISLAALAGTDLAGETEGFVPENAFGFSVLNNVRTADVSLNDAEATWFTAEGDADTVAAYAEELGMYGGENRFTENGGTGGSMFGSWGIAGVLNGAVWGVQNAPTHEALMQHWNTVRERLKSVSEEP